MIKRVIDISQQSYLHIERRQLLIERQGNTVARIPVEDIGVLILQHPAITLSHPLIVSCQKNNTTIIFCDERHLPYSAILPIGEGHTLHNKILQNQIALKTTWRKRLWQQLVKHKLQQQALTLEFLDKNNKGVQRLIRKVKSGDPENCEAQAARQYWQLLMGSDFRRDINASGVNALLNYGYAIMRAMMARALVGAGLHPTLGLHHSNQYNALCLADDVMEPLRPWVDYCVYQFAENAGNNEINQASKTMLLGLLSQTVIWQGQKMPLMVACHYLCAQLKDAYTDNSIKLDFPQWPKDMRR